MSYLARVSYNYDSKYLVTPISAPTVPRSWLPATAGVTSPRSRRVAYLGEKFLRDVSWINDLKLRAGWGQTVTRRVWRSTAGCSSTAPTTTTGR